MRKVLKWGFHSLVGHVAVFGSAFALAMLCLGLYLNYSEGTLTVDWALFIVAISIAAGVGFALLMWFTIISPLVRQKREADARTLLSKEAAASEVSLTPASPPIEFRVQDEVIVAQAAASAFFWRTFRTYTLKSLVAGAIFLPLGIWLTLQFVGDTWFIGVLSIALFMNVAYVPVFYFARRRAAAALVQRSPERQVRVTPTEITMSSTGGSVTLAWHRFHGVWEYPDFFILTLGRYFYWWLPRAGMPPEALSIIQAIANERLRSVGPRSEPLSGANGQNT